MKAKCKEMKVKCIQKKVKCEEVKCKYWQIYAKYERVFTKCNQSFERKAPENSQHTENEMFLNRLSDNDNVGDEMNCRKLRSRYVANCTLHSRKTREREPSRIRYKRVIKLFGKTRRIQDAVKSYLKKRIPSSSQLKQVLFGYNHYCFSDCLARLKFMLSKKSIHRTECVDIINYS